MAYGNTINARLRGVQDIRVKPQSGQIVITTSGGGGISDAPSDGTQYVRSNAAWVSNLIQSSGTSVRAGVNVLPSNTGANNSGFGYNTLYSNTSGYRNTGVGAYALYTNQTAYNNTAVGYYAGYSNTTGYDNVYLGYNAGYLNTTQRGNVAIGSETLQKSGINNTAIGLECLKNAGTASYNIAIGHRCLRNASSANLYNIAIGTNAMDVVTPVTGYQNIAIGSNALRSMGYNVYDNIAIGLDTSSNQGGSSNVAVGTKALEGTIGQSTSGVVAIGSSALKNKVSGYHTTAVGFMAGFYETSGINNLFLGAQSGWDAVANITTQSNYVVVGNNSITNANIKVGWTVTSDARDKCNITPCLRGLSFVSSLKPVKYQYRINRESDQAAPEARYRYGFLAQDILELEQDESIIIDDRDMENLKYNESSLIPVLVKAIQELKAEVEALKALQS